jgi:NADP-dependent 3-hydroxy acid dehydrogenase YdfG
MVNCIEDFYRSYGISAESLAHVVAFAINQPKEIDAHEILFHPTVQEL